MRVPQLLGAGAGSVASSVPLAAGQPAPLSRRQLLSGLALLGAGAAATGAAGAVVTGISTKPSTAPIAAPVAAAALVLSAPRVRIEAVGRQPGVLPPVDRPFAARGQLNDPNGAVAGSFAITPVPGAAGALQLHTFELEGGTLLGMGAASAGEGTFAVIGGTGRYRGATGSYTLRLSEDGSGRHASAEFNFHLAGE